MPQMLKQFNDIAENYTILLAIPGAVGELIGLLLYTFAIKSMPNKILQF